MKLLFLVTCVLLNTKNTNASKKSYGELPQPQYEKFPSEFPLGGLSGLFSMARGFVNMVFVNFKDITDLFEIILDRVLDNSVQKYLLTEWQQILAVQKGLIICLVFGLLFIILVIFGGMMTFLCRCCCSKCGGKYGQSTERAYSQKRVWLTYMMIMFIFLTFLPCVFIYVTSGWITDTLTNVPTQTDPRIENLAIYVENLPKQLEFQTDQLDVLTTDILGLVDNLNETIGNSLLEHALKIAQPTLGSLEEMEGTLNKTKDIASNANGTLSNLTRDMNNLKQETQELTDTIITELDKESACTSEPIKSTCDEIKNELNADLSLDYDATKLNTNDIESSIDKLNDIEIGKEIDNIEEEIKSIPQSIEDSSKDARKDIEDQLSKVTNDTIGQIKDLITANSTKSITSRIRSFKGTIRNGTEAILQYNHYQVYACMILASMINISLVFYFLGTALGTVYFNPVVEDRSFMSSLGGVFMILGTFFSFIFAWVVMILVIILFAVGGHGERYICQPVNQPYELFSWLQTPTENSTSPLEKYGLADYVKVNDIELNFEHLITSCESDKSLYESLRLNNTSYNTTYLKKEVSQVVTEIRNQVEKAIPDTIDIDVFPKDTEDRIDDFKDTGLKDIDLDEAFGEADKGLKTVNLTKFSNFLGEKSSEVRPTASAFADKIDGWKSSVEGIRDNSIPAIESDIKSLEDVANDLEKLDNNMTTLVDEIKVSLDELNKEIQNTSLIRTEGDKFANNIIDLVKGYVDWAFYQVENKFGACSPVFYLYTELVGLGCLYIINMMNGLWFSLGWAAFLMIPTAVIAMKLAKWYRGKAQQVTEEFELDEHPASKDYNSSLYHRNC